MTFQADSQAFDWHDPLQVIGLVLSLLVAIGFFVFVWWVGKVTRVWWFLGKVRDRWRAGQGNLPDPGACEWLGCQDNAMRWARYCSHHQVMDQVRAEESRRGTP